MIITKEEIIKVLEGLMETQMNAIIETVEEKGLTNTTFDDIGKGGGVLNFDTIARAIVIYINKKGATQ